MDKTGKYTTINLISCHQIAAAIADDGIREYRAAGGWESVIWRLPRTICVDAAMVVLFFAISRGEG
eukprot:scaffold13168_cov66-Cyclotella_meneghiniana.AAC.11